MSKYINWPYVSYLSARVIRANIDYKGEQQKSNAIRLLKSGFDASGGMDLLEAEANLNNSIEELVEHLPDKSEMTGDDMRLLSSFFKYDCPAYITVTEKMR